MRCAREDTTSRKQTAGRPISDARSSFTEWKTAIARRPSTARTVRRWATDLPDSPHPLDQRLKSVVRKNLTRSMRRYTILSGGIAALLSQNVCAAAAPLAYPVKPIRVIVPFAPGGGLDLSARLIGQKIAEKWGQNFVIDSRPGAATIVGTEIASHAVADGYTILMITTTFAINPSLYKKLPYDALRDFTPVTQLNTQPNIVVVSP